MKNTLILAMVVSVIMTLARSTGAHVGDVIFPIYELPTADLPDLHDGTLDDWEEVLPPVYLTHQDFTALMGVIDPADLAFRIFLAWHNTSQRIYVGIERIDDNFRIPGASKGGETNWFMVDGDHSGGPYDGFSKDDFSEEERKLFTQYQAQTYAFSTSPYSNRILGHPGAAEDWVIYPPWADAGGSQVGENPNVSVTEMAITPWDELHWKGLGYSQSSKLEPGKVIGFQIQVYDADESEPGEQSWFVLTSSLYSGWWVMSNADYFADGELIPCHRGDCSGASMTSVVLAKSWTRIKAIFK